MRRVKGYTLIEILVVLALISILLSMAVPNWSLYKRMKENMELETLKKNLLFTRNSAILEGTDYYVDFHYLENSYSIRNNKANGTRKTVYFQDGIKLNNRSGTITFSFKRNGTVGNSNSLPLKNSKDEDLKLTLSPTVGNINIKK